MAPVYNPVEAMVEGLKGFPIIIEQALNWGEMDMHGHVNNVWFFRYIENARIAYYEAIGKRDYERKTDASFVLASTTCSFKSPLVYPDIVIVGAKVEEILKDRTIMGYRLIGKKHNRIAAEAQATLVSFDYAKNRKIRFPEALRQRIGDLEGKAF